ncbi:ABC transporter substrate-binding protein [Variovorax sp. V118]
MVSATGPASFLGEPQRQTVEMYVKRINDAGGIRGEKLKLVMYDDGGDANASRTYASRLVEEDKVSAVLGGSGTGNSLAMMPVFESAEIPYISFSGGVQIIDPVRKWTFKPPHTDLMACQKIFEHMKKKAITRIAVIAGQGGFAKSMVTQCKVSAGQYGITIAAEESYGPRDSDMTPQLSRIKSVNGIQAIVNPDIGQSPAIVSRNFKQLGFTIPLYLSHAAATQGFLQLAGPAAEGVLLPAPLLLVVDDLDDSDKQKSLLKDYKTTFEKATGKSVDAFGGYAYDGLTLLVDAMKRAGSFDPAKVRTAIESTKNFPATVGTISMSSTDHLGIDLSSFRMLTVKSGKWVTAP